MELLNTQRDGEPLVDEIGTSFSKLSAERAANDIKKNFLKNGELTGGLATVAAVIPIVGQVVAIAATIFSVVQQVQTGRKIANLQDYVRSNGELYALQQGELDEINLSGGMEIQELRDQLNYVRAVKKAYGQTILISSALCLDGRSLRLLLEKESNLKAGDEVFIEQDENAVHSSYNGRHEVTNIFANGLIVEIDTQRMGSSGYVGGTISKKSLFDTYF